MDTDTTDRFRGDPAELETAEAIASVLRAAAGWLKLAAHLAAGDQARAETLASRIRVGNGVTLRTPSFPLQG